MRTRAARDTLAAGLPSGVPAEQSYSRNLVCACETHSRTRRTPPTLVGGRRPAVGCCGARGFALDGGHSVRSAMPWKQSRDRRCCLSVIQPAPAGESRGRLKRAADQAARPRDPSSCFSRSVAAPTWARYLLTAACTDGSVACCGSARSRFNRLSATHAARSGSRNQRPSATHVRRIRLGQSSMLLG